MHYTRKISKLHIVGSNNVLEIMVLNHINISTAILSCFWYETVTLNDTIPVSSSLFFGGRGWVRLPLG